MLTEDQLWEIFNADVSAASGADKAKGGVMAMARAVRLDAMEEVAKMFDGASAAFERNGSIDRGSLDSYFNMARTARAAAASVRDLIAKQ